MCQLHCLEVIKMEKQIPLPGFLKTIKEGKLISQLQEIGP
jgi:hypothetical protein